MILDADMKVYDWRGEVVVENPPAAQIAEALKAMGKLDRLSEVLEMVTGESSPPSTKPVTVGPLIAPYVAIGNVGAGIGRPPEARTSCDANSVACYALAARLYAGGKLELSNSDAELIRTCVESSPTPQRWVKGLVHYLLDPESVPEDQRKVFAGMYEQHNQAKVKN